MARRTGDPLNVRRPIAIYVAIASLELDAFNAGAVNEPAMLALMDRIVVRVAPP